ncbi:MAG: prolipoprotein diacylglyceryl transferase [Clostridia bacterium]|nr:prolipoprotein diacylglyceryl transferase [Clostridia bacterium]
MKTHIEFPNLGIDLNLNRRLVEFDALGGGIYYYAVIICLGFFLAWLYINNKEKRTGKSTEPILDMVLYALPAAIICARLYYVIFSFDSYKDDLSDIFKIWEGGLAIYGGIIGAMAVIIIYCRTKKLSVLHYLDLVSIGLFIGQAVGRWGNFVNGEAHGSVCSDSFLLGMCINGRGPFHPTFLYESVLNIAGFTVLHFLSKKIKYEGFCLYFYLTWYGLVRFFIEGLRTDSLYIPGTEIRTSQALSLVLFIVGITLLIKTIKANRQKVSG